jgi:hypothetical protein
MSTLGANEMVGTGSYRMCNEPELLLHAEYHDLQYPFDE